MIKNSILFLALFIQTSFAYDLPPPPERHSFTEQQELAELHAYQRYRTKEDCKKASAQEEITVNNLFGPSTGILSKQEVQQVENLGERLIAHTDEIVDPIKDEFDRKRPFTIDETLDPCVKKPGKRRSYPSGHATVGVVLANALAKVFPEKRDSILKQGFQIGKNRLIGGVHFPSDVKAGQELGQQISNE